MTNGDSEIRSKNSAIRKTLNRIGAISNDRVEIFSLRTRDNSNLNVFRDPLSKVIFIEDYYVGDDEYESGKYRETPKLLTKAVGRDFEDVTDSERRFNSYRQFLTGKVICDFGCGAGSFLKRSQSAATNVYGVELQQGFLDDLNSVGIECHTSLQEIDRELDVITLFHCLEHLPDPTSILKVIHQKLKQEGIGILIVEVPHARDFLIDHLEISEFIEFTLWSQHLILHTRESLRLLLADAGFKNIIIEGVQRYNFANHLNWLAKKTPGGHRSLLSIIETPELISSYKNALLKIDSTDTIVAIANT